MSYSQNDEEIHIMKACSAIMAAGRRRFLDIGAYHPTDKSNTRALYESGWTGVLIEPSPMCVRNLVREYGNKEGMTVICAAVSLDSQFVKLNITDDGLSTETISEAWRDKGGYFGHMFIHSMTIADILNRCGAFDFVSIDTEGTSIDLFQALLATEMFPQCICVEHDGRVIEAMQAARARGYHSVYESAENLVFSL